MSRNSGLLIHCLIDIGECDCSGGNYSGVAGLRGEVSAAIMEIQSLPQYEEAIGLFFGNELSQGRAVWPLAQYALSSPLMFVLALCPLMDCIVGSHSQQWEVRKGYIFSSPQLTGYVWRLIVSLPSKHSFPCFERTILEEM